jgi:hypothetical protein
MENFWFCAGTASFFTALFLWGFRVLPREEWQFLAIVPKKRLSPSVWDGLNLTYYGLFNALAHLVALFFFLLLSSSARLPLTTAVATIVLVMSVAIPSSRLLARLIEKKPHTATVSGGFFMGLLFAPAAVGLAHFITGAGGNVPYQPFFAAMAIAYAFGEGTGRLGCLSFGCCYGRPLSDDPRSPDRFIRPVGLIFTGKTKKISYASGWDGRLVWPVQAVTSVIHTAVGLAAICLFLAGRYWLALILTLSVTQVWRAVSELFRGDYRGGGRISVYQIFSLLAAFFATLTLPFAFVPGEPPDLALGFRAIWSLPMALFLEAWFVFVFFHSGRSSVTGSSLSFHVKKENI